MLHACIINKSLIIFIICGYSIQVSSVPYIILILPEPQKDGHVQPRSACKIKSLHLLKYQHDIILPFIILLVLFLYKLLPTRAIIPRKLPTEHCASMQKKREILVHQKHHHPNHIIKLTSWLVACSGSTLRIFRQKRAICGQMIFYTTRYAVKYHQSGGFLTV